MEEIRLNIKLLKERLNKDQKVNMHDLIKVIGQIVNVVDNKQDKKTR